SSRTTLRAPLAPGAAPVRRCPGGVRRSAGAPHLTRVAEAERPLGGLREVEFAAGHVGPAVDDPDAHGAPAVAERHARAAWQRLAGHAERAARERAAAGEAAAAAVPGCVGEAKDVEPADALAGGEVRRVAGEAQAHP